MYYCWYIRIVRSSYNRYNSLSPVSRGEISAGRAVSILALRQLDQCSENSIWFEVDDAPKLQSFACCRWLANCRFISEFCSGSIQAVHGK